MSKRRKDRKRLGVNFLSVLRAAKKVASDPSFEPESTDEMAEAVLAEIVGVSFPQAKLDWQDIDWEAIIAFIMKILPLLLLFI
jgi:hypothetical protein